ncbi:AAA family ATPase [Planctellipticum variicoloris]|uniref:AAA family ATPase n=1 Tax=Planctellipticum variicoloris TaxID=3064265 RepID=UPI003013C540|nr:AAA family ATPase [Planctomycetaceae bacterium SH412]
MSNVIRVAIVDPVDFSRNELKTMLLGLDVVWLVADCQRFEFFPDVVAQAQPDLALVVLDSNPAKGLELIGRIHADAPDCSVLVVSSSTEGSLILQAMRNGAKEFLAAPLKIDDFLSALDRLRHLLTGKTSVDGQVRASQVIALAGASGGVGCTSLAINLGCCLAQRASNSVSIIDLDLALGDTDVWLDIIPDYTIQDVADNITRLDYSLLKRSLTKHDCGAYLLPRPADMDIRLPMSADELRRVIALLKSTFSHLVIDIGKSYGDLDVAALESSNTILLVTQLDLPSLRNAVRLLQFFHRFEGMTEKVRIVINRLGLEENQISVTKAFETLGHEIFAQIPNEYSAMVESRNSGVPVVMQAPRSKLTRAIQQLAGRLDESLLSDPKADPKKGRKGLFGFLSAGSK